MITFKSRLIIGIISKIIKTIFKIVYKILSVFNLQATLFVLIVGAILFLTGVLTDSILVIFYVALVLSIVYALFATVRKLLGLDKRVSKSKGVQIVKEEKPAPIATETPHVEPVPVYIAQPTESNVPKYFKVRQNPNYIMAEYPDRYELYLKTPQGLKKIRVDYK